MDGLGKELAEEADRQLSSLQAPITHLSMDGSDAVWYETKQYRMYRYDFAKKTESLIGTGKIPVVAKHRAVYVSLEDGGLVWTDLNSGETLPVLKLPYGQSVTNVVFNGSQGLFKQSDAELRTKIVASDWSDPKNPRYTDVTPQSKKAGGEYYQLYIGSGQAAWVEAQEERLCDGRASCGERNLRYGARKCCVAGLCLRQRPTGASDG